jgi:hypothetical protein
VLRSWVDGFFHEQHFEHSLLSPSSGDDRDYVFAAE